MMVTEDFISDISFELTKNEKLKLVFINGRSKIFRSTVKNFRFYKKNPKTIIKSQLRFNELKSDPNVKNTKFLPPPNLQEKIESK